jgi:hypothetical protein
VTREASAEAQLVFRYANSRSGAVSAILELDLPFWHAFSNLCKIQKESKCIKTIEFVKPASHDLCTLGLLCLAVGCSKLI